MPEISRFLGIVIFMYASGAIAERARCDGNEFAAVFNLRTLNIMEGKLPARVRGLVEEWAELHQEELLAMWESKDFHKVEPLV